jgi:hypothetical protein
MNITAFYRELITAIGDGTGASDSLLHVHGGLAILFLARLITRRSLATPIPFLVVVAAEAANEIMDRLTYGSWRVEDTSLDILNTLFWPFVLMVGLRWRRAHDIAPPPHRAVGLAG